MGTIKGLTIFESVGKYTPTVAKKQTMVDKVATTVPKSTTPLPTANRQFCCVLLLTPHLHMF